MTLTLLATAAFVAGLVGSAHCVGMCGPVVVLLERSVEARTAVQAALRRVVYNGGRLLCYMTLGALAGLGGYLLADVAGLQSTGRALRIAAAVMVAFVGLRLIVNWRGFELFERAGARVWQRLAPLTRHVVPLSSTPRALAAGFLWGALPCGLVYSIVAVAATSASMVDGALVMLAFWAGTLPSMLATGTLALKLSNWRARPVHRRIAGAALVASACAAIAMPYFGGHGAHGGHAPDGAPHAETNHSH